MAHVFISYVREDAVIAKRLASELEASGAEVWLDRDRLTPGVRWQSAIRQAIERGAFFVACFSEHSAARNRSYMNEELVLAIDELRRRPTDRAWFLPVLLSAGTLPYRAIGAGETLADIQYVELHSDWDEGVRRLLAVINPESAPGQLTGRTVAGAPSGPSASTSSNEWCVNTDAFQLSRREFASVLRHRALRNRGLVCVVLTTGLLMTIGFATASEIAGPAAAALIVVLIWLWSGAAYLQWRRNPHLADTQRWSFDERGVLTVGPSSRSEIPWAYLAEVVEVGDLYVMLLPGGLFLIVPRRAFALPADETRFRLLVGQQNDAGVLESSITGPVG